MQYNYIYVPLPQYSIYTNTHNVLKLQLTNNTLISYFSFNVHYYNTWKIIYHIAGFHLLQRLVSSAKIKNYLYHMDIYSSTYVTRSGKTGLIHTFCILRNTYLKYSMRCPSLVVQYNHARCIILIVQLYSQHLQLFLQANWMLLVF